MDDRIRDRTLTVDEVGIVADVIGGLGLRNPQYKAIIDHLSKDWHEWMRAQPHEHYFSILGPYCAACHEGILQGEWETTKVPQ